MPEAFRLVWSGPSGRGRSDIRAITLWVNGEGEKPTMNRRRSLRDRRAASSALLPVLAALVAGGLLAASASASAPQNAAAYNEIAGLPTITGPSPTPVPSPNCGLDKPKAGDALTASTGTWSQ